MMKSKVEVEEIISVLEKIRQEKYPEISNALIRNIVESEFEQQDSRLQAQKVTKKLIADFLKATVAEEV